MKNSTLAFVGCILVSAPLYADHSWGPYHWARTTTSFDLIVVNSTTSDWDSYVIQATSDWGSSRRLDMVQDWNDDTSTRTRRHCPAPSGRVRICNLAYGYNGWLGVAGIYIDTNGHIQAGYTKLNDSYFSSSYYNHPNWKQSVTCQELGHNLGLDHQDEDFDNTSLSSCMDYQDPPYQYPNAHDYDQLETIYAHKNSYDSYDTGTSGSGDGGDDGGCNAPPGKGCNKGQAGGGFPGDVGWGMSLGRRGQKEKFLRIEPDGTRIVTFVTWAIGH
jgi:hypothetical protein